MNVIRIKLWRAKGRFCLFFVALVMGMLIWLLLYQLYAQSVSSAQYIELHTTTLAIQNSCVEMETLNGNVFYRIEMPDAEKLQAARASSSVLNDHQSASFSGYAEGVMPVVPTEMNDRLNTAGGFFGAENTAIFTVKISSIDDSLPMSSPKYVDGQWIQANRVYYSIKADVVEVHILNPGYSVPQGLTIQGSWVEQDGSIPFHTGETWLMVGTYEPAQPVWSNVNGHSGYGEPGTYDNVLRLMLDGYPAKDNFFQNEEGQWVAQRYQQEEYPLYMLVDDKQLSTMLELAQLNSSLLWVTGIDTLDAVPLFAQGDASLVQGRSLTEAESVSGERVCLISDTLAEANELMVGQEIELSLYENDFAMQLSSTPYIRMGQLYPMSEAAGQEKYTIIGIYHTVEWQQSLYCFSPNTIFVPEASLPKGGYPGVSYASSLILRNGQMDAFLSDVEAAGLPSDTYAVSDNGYTSYMASLEAMKVDTRTALGVGSLLYLVVVTSSVALMVNHLRQDADVMVRIGATTGQARAYMLGCLFPMTALAGIAAYGMCCVLYAPLIQIIAEWYAMTAPRFSDLTDTSLLFSSATMIRPSPGIILAGMLPPVLIAALLARVPGERRGA